MSYTLATSTSVIDVEACTPRQTPNIKVASHCVTILGQAMQYSSSSLSVAMDEESDNAVTVDCRTYLCRMGIGGNGNIDVGKMGIGMRCWTGNG